MRRSLVIAFLVSLLLHGGIAFGGYLFPKKAAAAVVVEETPTIELDLPPPPEPDEPEIVEDIASEAPAESVDLAPPMQNDAPSAVIDSPFVQKMQAPPPPSIGRPAGGAIVLPTAPPRGSVGGGLKNIFNLADLDQRPQARVRTMPSYPPDMRRSGLKGQVVVGFIVDTRGEVLDPYIVRSSHPGFEQAAIDTVLKWKFTPGRKGGAAVNTKVQQPIEFNLSAQ